MSNIACYHWRYRPAYKSAIFLRRLVRRALMCASLYRRAKAFIRHLYPPLWLVNEGYISRYSMKNALGMGHGLAKWNNLIIVRQLLPIHWRGWRWVWLMIYWPPYVWPRQRLSSLRRRWTSKCGRIQRCISTCKHCVIWIIKLSSLQVASKPVEMWEQDGLPEPEATIAEILLFIIIKQRRSYWQAKESVITAGATVEAIDPVRYLSNHSTGKMGFALARACVAAGQKLS